MDNAIFLEATIPDKKVQVKANKINGLVLIPLRNENGRIVQTYKTPIKGRQNKGYLILPNATTPASGRHGTKKGGKRRKRRTRKH